MKEHQKYFPEKWHNAYNIDVPIIDEQHKQLFVLIQNLEDLQKKQAAPIDAELLAAFYKLAQFAGDQLIREEMYLQSIGSPTLPKHKKLHQGFVSQIIAYQKSIEEGGNPLKETVRYLKHWFVDHCLAYDREALKKRP